VATWTDVYRTERDGLVRLAYLITGSQAVAEDLVQDTFVRVMGRLDPDASPGRTSGAASSTPAIRGIGGRGGR
jgi:DNA-directed RNA polymerase specialized sigma24 family protein